MGIKQFIEDTRAEVKKVNWPTKHKVIQSTIIVLIVVVVMTVIVSILDVGLGNLFDIINAKF